MSKLKNMTEFEMQNALRDRFQLSHRHWLITPNTTIYGWEADLISVTKANLVHEFEIKRTKADFRADAIKREKHELLEHGEFISDWQIRYAKATGRDISKIKPKVGPRPNYFWYVISGFELTKEDIPSYAGLIIVKKEKGNASWLKVVKNAPRLHTGKISDVHKFKLYEAMTWRYWTTRTHEHFSNLFNRIGKWSIKVFGADAPAVSKLHHLKKEVDELIESPYALDEYADSFILLMDAARAAGYSPEDVLDAIGIKHDINEFERTWKSPDEFGCCFHIKDNEDACKADKD